jgi:hypothetical protein
MYQTPRDVLESIYRQALAEADALGCDISAIIADMDDETATELEQYIESEYRS